MDEDVKIRVCRLCFNLISDRTFSPITGSLQDMLKVITSDLNLNVSDSPVMCKECLDVVQDVFNFKTNCFESEEIIESNLPDRCSKWCLVDIMSDTPIPASARTKLKKDKICRTCLEHITGHFVVLNKKSDVTLSLMLESCLSELDFKLTANPVMCITCYETLQKMSMFKIICKQNECKIEAYLKTVDTKNFRNVNLHGVLQFSLDVEVNANNVDGVNIKTEPKWERLDECRVPNCNDYVMVKIETTNDEEDEEPTQKSEDENDITDVNKPESRYPTRNRKKRKPPKTNTRQKIVTRQSQCPDCDFKTKYKYNLRRHVIITHHRRDGERLIKRFYKCPDCSFGTRWQLDLTRHMLSHVKPEAFQCTRCPYSTNQNSHLIKHILSHVNADSVDKNKFLQTSS